MHPRRPLLQALWWSQLVGWLSVRCCCTCCSGEPSVEPDLSGNYCCADVQRRRRKPRR